MKQLTVQEALQNIDIVVSNAHMDRKEHQALQQSIVLVTQRCELADKLEKEQKDGTANKQPIVPGTPEEDSE